VIKLSNRPGLVIPVRDLFVALVFTQGFWKKAKKLGIEDRVLDLINNLVIRMCEYGGKSIDEPRISRIDDIHRIRLGKYRLFYKFDRSRGWLIFYDIEKRKEHTYRHERSLKHMF